MRELLIYIQTRDLCPTFEEMMDALGLTSKASVQRVIKGLEERGYIRRLSMRARAIEVLRPIRGGLCVVFGPDHFEMRAAEKRRLWQAGQG
jgi:repressor LexA